MDETKDGTGAGPLVLDGELINDGFVDPPEEAVRTPRSAPRRSGGSTDRRVGMFVRLDESTKERGVYWAEKGGYSSLNEYMAEALVEKIERENKDYDLPTLEIARLNQLVDEVTALSKNSANLERVVTQGLGTLIGLTRGDNYLTDDEDGEL